MNQTHHLHRVEINSNTSLYSFRFKHFQMEIPYANVLINMYSPWSYILSWGSCLLYLFLITTIFPLFKSKLTKNIATNHYALLFLYSFFSFVTILIYEIQTNQIINWRDWLCTPIPCWVRLLSITFTVSKIWEWFDTAILISKGHSLSKIGFLHIYHHATTFLLFLCVMNLPGAEKNSILFNGLIHTLMYYHFAFRLPKILRPMITLLQILQLLLGTYLWHIIPDVCPAYKDFPRQNFLEFLIPYACVPVYCLFFFKFFFQQYLLPYLKKSKSFSSQKED